MEYRPIVNEYNLNDITEIRPGGPSGIDLCHNKCRTTETEKPGAQFEYSCIDDEVCLGHGIGKCVCEMEGKICKATFEKQHGEDGGCTI